jgi:tetratricopeptide (TPR) repeat protein
MKLITAPFNFSVALMTLVFFSVIIVPVSGQQSTSLQEPQILLDKANSLLQQRNFSGARIAFQRFLTQNSHTSSDNSEAAYGLAYAALQAKHKDGEVLMQSFISNHQNNVRRNPATFYLAQHFYQNQKYSKAITAFSNVEFQSLTYSQQVEGKFQLGYSNFTERKLEEALLYFNQIKFTEHAYSAASSYYAGFIEFDRSLYDQALIDLKKAESSEAYASIVPYLIASVYYRKGAYAELLAYAEAKKSVDNLKNKNELILLIAEASYSLGDFAKAAESYAVALKDTKLGDAAIWYRAGMSLDQIGNKKDAINMLELAATTTTPVAFIASYQLGILYLQQGEKVFAVNAFNRARKSEDATVAEQAQFTYAKVLYDQGQSEKAIVEFERYLEIYPKAPSANATKELLAQAYINGNNYQKAIEYIESLSVKSPVIEQAYQKASFLKGSEFYNKDRYSEAITFFKKSLSYPRDESFIQRASFWCAEAFAILRNYSEAEEMYKRCIQIQTTDQSIYLQAQYGLSYVLYNHKKFEEALEGFKIVVSKSSKQAANYTDAQLRLADCYYTTRDFEQALIFYTQYIKSGGLDRDYAYLQSGMVYGIQRNYAESKKQFTLLINSFPKSTYRAEAFYQRAQFDIEQGDYVSAINGLTSLLQAGIGSPFIPYAYARRAASFYNTKDFDKTVQDYLSLLRSYPTHPLSQEVLLPLQEALDRIGRSAEFPSYLSMVKKANPDTKGLESLEFETAKKMYFNERYASAIESFTSFKSITDYVIGTKHQPYTMN